MSQTLYTIALLQWSESNISSCGVCLEDIKNAGYKKWHTRNELMRLRKKWYIEITGIEYPRGMKRFYHKLTIKGKQKLWLKLSAWEKFFLLFQ
jgi:hypothetical protein